MRHGSIPALRPILLATSILIAWVGCGRDDAPGPPSLRIVERWAPSDPVAVFSSRELLAPDPIAIEATCAVGTDPSRSDLEQIRCSPPRLDPGPYEVELALDGANLSEFRLVDPTSGEAIARSRPEPEGAARSRYRFFVEAGERLHGQPIVLRQVGASAGALRAVEVVLRPLRPSPERAAAAVAQAWKLAIGDEWRTGFPALPGDAVRWTLQAPARGDVVETAIAGPAELELRLVFEDRRGARLLFEGSPPQAGGESAWTPVRRALAAEPECPCALALETRGGDGAGWGGWAEPTLLRAGPERPDLILISLDTVRADRLSPYGGPPDLTPFLRRLASERATLFEVAVAPSTWTFPSHLSMLSGLEAFRHRGFSESDTDAVALAPNLAVLLRSAGYRTVAITADGFVHPRLGFSLGFDETVTFPFERDPDRELETGVRRAIERLARDRDRPVFLFFHTYEAHVPNSFRPSSRLPSPNGREQLAVLGHRWGPDSGAGFVGQQGFQIADRRSGSNRPAVPADAALLLDAYDRSLAHLDDQLALLFAECDQLAGSARSLVVVTSDHGESLGEHARMSHALLDDANLLVPLLVDWPGADRPVARYPQAVSLVDLVPTFLAEAGLESPAGLDGVSLRERIRRGAPESTWSYVASNNQGLALRLPGGRKLIFRDGAWRGTAERARLLDPARDPAETEDLSDSEPEWPVLLREARRALRAGLTGLRVTIENRSERKLELELRHPALRPGSVKLFAADVELEWVRPGRARVRLTPGATGDWILLDARSDRVDLEGAVRTPNGPGSPFEIHAAARSSVLSGRLAGDAEIRWRDGSPASPDLVVSLAVRGFAKPGAALVEDQELQDNLRALGYVD